MHKRTNITYTGCSTSMHYQLHPIPPHMHGKVSDMKYVYNFMISCEVQHVLFSKWCGHVMKYMLISVEYTDILAMKVNGHLKQWCYTQ